MTGKRRTTVFLRYSLEKMDGVTTDNNRIKDIYKGTGKMVLNTDYLTDTRYLGSQSRLNYSRKGGTLGRWWYGTVVKMEVTVILSPCGDGSDSPF